MIEYLQSKNLADLSMVTHGFFLRQGGVSVGAFESLNCSLTSLDSRDSIAENHRRVASHIGVEPSRLVTCWQVHGTDVKYVKEPWALANSPEADALVTDQGGLALGIVSADCVPVLFADPTARVIGAAHAGWRSAHAGIIERTIEAMEKLGANRQAIQVALGPCIWQDSYEVDERLRQHFVEQNDDNKRFFVESERLTHYMFDLPAYVRSCVIKTGAAGCAMSLMDTYVHAESFFSCRRNAHQNITDYGAQISVIMLKI